MTNMWQEDKSYYIFFQLIFSRSPGDAEKNYVSTVSNDEFHEFQQNGYHDEEDIDFTPQNGYLDPEDEAPMPSKGKWVEVFCLHCTSFTIIDSLL